MVKSLDLASFYKGKKVLLTGHTGFKGSWLGFWLTEMGARVQGYALAAEGETPLFSVLGLEKRMKSQIADIRDAAKVAETVADFQPEIVIHLAAQPIVRTSYDDPLLTYSTNVMGSAHLLDAVRKTPSIRSLVFITSDKCYKNKEWVWGYRETDELGGHDPYSASKAAAEIVFSSYYDSFLSQRDQLGSASVRAGNVIGGGDWSKDRIVPDCIRALRSQKPIQIRNPKSTRPWQHVLEPLSGYLLMGKRLYENPKKFSGAWNFGPRSSQACDVQALAEAALKHWGSGTFELAQSSSSGHEAGLLQLNCDKANLILGWQPRWGLEATFRETVSWYRAHNEGRDMVEFTRRQIQTYLETQP